MRSKLVRDHVEAAERDALAGHADVATEELAKALLSTGAIPSSPSD